MELVSRAVFAAASVILAALAAALIAYGGYQVVADLGAPPDAIAARLLDAVGYVVIAIAIFDVAKYLIEEEVVRGRELRNASEVRRSLTKFVSTIAIAVLLEALVLVFEAGQRERASDMIYPILLLLAGIALILGLGGFQRLSVMVEGQAEARDRVADQEESSER